MIFKRSLISELANSAGGVFTVLFTIVIAVGMVRVLSLASGGRIDNAAVLQMVVYQALINLAPLLAVSLFIAVLMTMMRWWQDNEMVVWYSSGGRSLLSWVTPVLRFSVPLILAVGLLSLVISPWASSQADQTRATFQQRDDVNRIAPGRFIQTLGGRRVFFVESAGENSNEVGRIFMSESAPDKESTVVAQSGEVRVNEEGDRYIVLHEGRRYETEIGSPTTRIVEFKEYGMRVDVKIDRPLADLRTRSLPTPFLFANPTAENLGQALWRISWPFAAFNLVLLALPLSCTSPRAGRSLNLIMAALVFILYLNAISIFQTWVEHEQIGLWTGLATLHGLVFALVVVCFVRWVYFMSWLPAWASPGALWRRLRSRKEAAR